MKKLSKTSELMWLFGVIFVSLGVAVCSKSNLGLSMIAAPQFVIYDALAPLWSGFSVGMVGYLFQGVLLIVLCVTIRRFDVRYLLSFGVAVAYGYMLNFFLFLLGDFSADTVFVRWVTLIVGDIFTALGVACFFRTYMPLQVFELFVAELSSKYKLNINRTKLFFDLALLVFSIVLALILFADDGTLKLSSLATTDFHGIGLGTLVTTLINSPLIALCGRFLDKVFDPTPIFPKLKKYIGH